MARAVSNAVLPPPFSANKDRGVFFKCEPKLVEATVVLEADFAKLESAHCRSPGWSERRLGTSFAVSDAAFANASYRLQH